MLLSSASGEPDLFLYRHITENVRAKQVGPTLDACVSSFNGRPTTH